MPLDFITTTAMVLALGFGVAFTYFGYAFVTQLTSLVGALGGALLEVPSHVRSSRQSLASRRPICYSCRFLAQSSAVSWAVASLAPHSDWQSSRSVS
ncbi:hypothetical protein ACFFQF_00625 [Haladaptatus pallidirubidus]|uniref:hypothetical protein n=1 Tax=Haladaptatus pallidirubidus TaxID=1008152 RepID=UPI0035E46F04